MSAATSFIAATRASVLVHGELEQGCRVRIGLQSDGDVGGHLEPFYRVTREWDPAPGAALKRVLSRSTP